MRFFTKKPTTNMVLHVPRDENLVTGAGDEAMMRAALDVLQTERPVTVYRPLPAATAARENILSQASACIITPDYAEMDALIATLMQRGIFMILPDIPTLKQTYGNAALYVKMDAGGDVPAAIATALFGVLSMPALQAHFRKAMADYLAPPTTGLHA